MPGARKSCHTPLLGAIVWLVPIVLQRLLIGTPTRRAGKGEFTSQLISSLALRAGVNNAATTAPTCKTGIWNLVGLVTLEPCPPMLAHHSFNRLSEPARPLDGVGSVRGNCSRAGKFAFEDLPTGSSGVCWKRRNGGDLAIRLTGIRAPIKTGLSLQDIPAPQSAESVVSGPLRAISLN